MKKNKAIAILAIIVIFSAILLAGCDYASRFAVKKYRNDGMTAKEARDSVRREIKDTKEYKLKYYKN
ncbi:hypothetical protein A2997_00660 [Candidatus Nomurabacteria bacterium RIFCSPLOWO2_01_FULL_36_10b]|uniref:Lipoprotein n=1 Tax=Candidatus Nomurabacteria bacterium RIFCSPLOWO2_01_FULL_36_10b TaxID=1801766 RepID=A0A1F6WNS4_9BACT|nr:MAG: hypothetical protein A2997_00660 [Candidatus Nomurabacteria bacterium RIFCSPLOWO2_01_FULL_36_10b]